MVNEPIGGSAHNAANYQGAHDERERSCSRRFPALVPLPVKKPAWNVSVSHGTRISDGVLKTILNQGQHLSILYDIYCLMSWSTDRRPASPVLAGLVLIALASLGLTPFSPAPDSYQADRFYLRLDSVPSASISAVA